MDTNKLLKVLVATNVLTLLVAGAAAYFAMEARDFSDEAYAAAVSASRSASDVAEILSHR